MPLDMAANVLSNTRLSGDYNVLALAAPDIASAAAPGQFVMVKTGERLEPLLRRPFSVFEILKAGGRTAGLSILNKRIGPSTGLLFDARPGDRIQCLGPLGRPFVPVAAPEEAWLVAGGVGLAPFVMLAEALRAKSTPTRLYYGARRASELFFLDEFEKLGVQLILTTEDGSRVEADPERGRRARAPETGRVTVALEQDLRDRPKSTGAMLYACGPEAMLAAVARLAAAHGRPSQVSVERVMGCGLGGCYSCVIPLKSKGRAHYVRSCIAGPVFRGDEIEWQ